MTDATARALAGLALLRAPQAILASIDTAACGGLGYDDLALDIAQIDPIFAALAEAEQLDAVRAAVRALAAAA